MVTEPQSKRAKTKTSGDHPPPPATGFELPENYKAKRCKYCRVWSVEECAWPLRDSVLSQWNPCVPWARGTLAKPIGDMCKPCMVVSRLL